MTQRSLFPAHVVLGCIVGISSSCGSDSSGPDVETFPDISGSWTVSMSAVPNGTNGSDGSCTFEPLALDLARSGAETRTALYTGLHPGTLVNCVGFTPRGSELSGWSDTVIVIPEGNLAARVQEGGCFLDLPCAGPGIHASITISTELTITGLAGEEYMSGYLHFIDGPWIRLEGSWTARR